MFSDRCGEKTCFNLQRCQVNLFCFGTLEASQQQDVVKSSAAPACLFHTKHNSVYIFIGKLGPTHLRHKQEPRLQGCSARALRSGALLLGSALPSEVQELACKGLLGFSYLPASC